MPMSVSSPRPSFRQDTNGVSGDNFVQWTLLKTQTQMQASSHILLLPSMSDIWYAKYPIAI